MNSFEEKTESPKVDLSGLRSQAQVLLDYPGLTLADFGCDARVHVT